jgi:hypothetical protein
MHETPVVCDLNAMSEVAGDSYPDSPLPLAIVAEVEPSLLSSALNTFDVRNMRSALVLTQAQECYKKEHSKTDKKRAAPNLYEAAQRVISAEEQHAAIQEQVTLANDIHQTRERLTKPMRTLAIVLGALVIGGGTVGEIRTHEHTRYGQVSKSVNGEHITETIFGTFGGGLAGSIIGIGLTGREARRRARKIVTKA